MISSTNSGMLARAAQSAEREATCSCVGTSPVNRSQKRPSGSGSEPPGAFGSKAWHSGIVLPRNRIPSSVDQSIRADSKRVGPTCIENGSIP